MQTVFIAVWLDLIVCFNGLIFCSVLVSDDEINKINLKPIKYKIIMWNNKPHHQSITLGLQLMSYFQRYIGDY